MKRKIDEWGFAGYEKLVWEYEFGSLFLKL
jgi:hypothetical protein